MTPRVPVCPDHPEIRETPSTLNRVLNNHVTTDGYRVTTLRTQKRNFGWRCIIGCVRNQISRQGRGIKNVTHTSLTQEDKKCQFHFPIFYDNSSSLYYVSKNCNHCLVHSGHLPTNREHMRHGVSTIPQEVREVAEQLLGKGCPNSIVNLLLSVMSEDRITPDAMSKMRRAILITKHGNTDKNESTAETLLRMLDEKEGTSYDYMTGTYDEALDLVRVRKGENTVFIICNQLVLSCSYNNTPP